jgi:signal transduction histidine kinase
MAVQLGSVWLSLAAIGAVGRRVGTVAAIALPLGVITTAVISLVRSELAGDYIASELTGRSVSFIVLASLLVVVLTNAAMASQLSQETIIERLHATIDATVTEAQARNRELARASRTLARYVHGTLQSRLLASALAIEQAERIGDAAAFDHALEQAREALLLPELLPPPETHLAAAINRAMMLWQGIATITVHITQELPPLPPSSVAEICLIVEEGVANAMRHGSALTVAVTLAPNADGSLTITITDDGTGPTGGSPGLGSTIFDQASTAPWTLVPCAAGPGSVLRVVVRMPAPATPTGR